MFNTVTKNSGLGNQNCNMTDWDFLLLIAGKPLVKLDSLQVNFSPSLPCLHGAWMGEKAFHTWESNKLVV